MIQIANYSINLPFFNIILVLAVLGVIVYMWVRLVFSN